MNDLFNGAPKGGKRGDYTAKDIEVLEGLEPVRRRPGMFIGGTDESALHHLAAEILDNAMDEAVAGHASFIEVTLEPENFLIVRDNGRGIPIDPHPKFKQLSALEVILTTLHSGGKFGGNVYRYLRRSARRRRVGRECAVRITRGRCRPRPRILAAALRSRQVSNQTCQCRLGAEPPRHHHSVQARSADLRRDQVQPDETLSPVPLEGLPVPGC